MRTFFSDTRVIGIILSVCGVLIMALSTLLWGDRTEAKQQIKALECRMDEAEKNDIGVKKDIVYIKMQVDEILKEVRK